MRNPRTHSSAPWSRLGLWLTAWLVLAGQTTGIAHHLAVVHEVCAQHGEWVHAGEGHAVPDVVVPNAAVTALSAVVDVDVDVAQELGAGDAHEHCFTLSHRRDWTLTARVASCEPVGEAVADVIGKTRRVESSAPIYRVAPKQSPPSTRA